MDTGNEEHDCPRLRKKKFIEHGPENPNWSKAMIRTWVVLSGHWLVLVDTVLSANTEKV